MIGKQFHVCPVSPVVRITGFCSAHENKKPVGYSYEGESHDFWESLFMVEGQAVITAGETVFTLHAGQMIFHPPGEFHRIRNGGEGDMRFFVISFSADRFSINTHRICSFSNPEQVGELVHTLRELFVVKDRQFLTEPRADAPWGEIQKTVNRLEDLFIDLLSQGERTHTQHDKNAELYSAAVAVMHRDLSGNLTAPQIASLCQTGLSTLQKLFARYTGMGVIRYYTKLRMSAARALLQEGYNVKEAAARLGFMDQNYFSTVYKRHFGHPPSTERARE